MQQLRPSRHFHPVRSARDFVERHRLASILVLGGILLALAANVALYLYSQMPESVIASSAAVVKKPVPKKYYSLLTGLEVPDEAATKQAVTAIMIENSPDARPQSGLKQAGIVYEAIAEGGITRFLTIHQQDKPQLIGPVRSVRMYYVDWLAPYQASVAHIGGSAAALTEVRNGNYRDIDQFFNGNYYWRSSDRYAPHNVYTSFAKLDALNQSKGYTTSQFTGFARTGDAPSKAPDASSINIAISGPLYNSSYAYDAASNSYLRSQAGAKHIDREDGQIQPKVVVAMFVDMSLVQEDGYRESITTTGTGRAVIFQNGVATEAQWQKVSRAEPLKFVDNAGKEVALNRGQTWISALPNGQGDASWK